MVVAVDRVDLGPADNAQRHAVRAVALHSARRVRAAGYHGPHFVGDCSTWWSVRAPAGDEPLLLAALLGVEAGSVELAALYLTLGHHERRSAA